MSNEFPKGEPRREAARTLLMERHRQGIQRIIKDTASNLKEKVTLLTRPGVDAGRTYIVEPTEKQREYDRALELVPHTTIPVPSSVSPENVEVWIREAENFIRGLGYTTMRRPGPTDQQPQPYIDIVFSSVVEG